MNKNYCFECKKAVDNLDKHLEKIQHKTKLYRQDYNSLCHYCNCMQDSIKDGFCKQHQNKKKHSKSKIFRSLEDVKCPICKGVINNKWFNFRNGQVVDFTAECWSGDIYNDKPRHIFSFQLEIPKAVLISAVGSKVFD